jgi:hypothetical protein
MQNATLYGFFNLSSFYVLTDNRKFNSCDQQDQIPNFFQEVYNSKHGYKSFSWLMRNMVLRLAINIVLDPAVDIVSFILLF